MSDISIFQSDLFPNDVHAFLNQIYAETYRKGYSTRQEILLDRQHHCVMAKRGDRVVGAIAYHVSAHDGIAVIAIGGVDEEFRNRGIYAALKDRLEEVVRAAGLTGIETLIYNGNAAMISHAIADGYETHYSSYSKKL